MTKKNRTILIVLFFVFLGFSIALSALFYVKTEKYALLEAQKQGKDVLYAHRAVQAYITNVQRPELYAQQEKGLLSSEYFSPTLFSSTYIARNITSLLNAERKRSGLPEIYFKLASDNPRNPINQADAEELVLLKRINTEGMREYNQLVDRPDGKWLYMAVPTQKTGTICLKCHGDPADAPKDLVRLYGNKAGFFEKSGQHRALISIRVPLAPTLVESHNLFIILTTITIVSFSVIYLIIFQFLRHIDKKQQALSQTSQRLELALKSGTFGIWEWDIQNNSLVWDDHMFELYGLTRGEVKENFETWENCLYPQDRSSALSAIKAALNGEREYDISFRIVQPVGTIKFIKAEGHVVRDTFGNPQKMIGLNSDISEQNKYLENIIKERNKAQLYLDIAGVMFAAINEHGEIILINKRGCEILGYDEDKLLGQNWFDICLPKSAVEIVKEVFTKQMAGNIETVEFFENAIINHDGNERMIAFHNTLLRDDDGMIRGVLFSGEDITERKEAQQSLEKAANEWQAAMDASDDAIYLLDLNRKLLRANRAFYLMTGVPPGNSLGRHISEIIHPDHVGPCVLCQAEENMQDFVTVLEVDHPDNHVRRPIEVNIKMVRDNNGDPLSILVTRHDLTFDRKTQETLRETEERYRQLVELSQDIIFIQSSGIVVFINDAGVRMFGASSSSDIIAKPMLDLIHPDSKELVISRMKAATEQEGKLPVVEVKYLRMDGTFFFGEVTATSMLHQGKPAVHVFVRDITVRKSLEDQLRHSQKLEAVGHLAGGIAHDFNNILTVISGYSALLEMAVPTHGTGREMIGHIVSATERATNLTRSLLAFSRKQEMRPKNENLNEIIQNVGKFLMRIIGEDITLTTTLSNDPLMVFADKGQIEQVLMNLATNARDVMDNGGTLAIETQIIEMDDLFIQSHGFGTPGNYALITVSDNGQGMDEETKTKIFEPFFTTKEVGRGTGLGLSIVYGIVSQHNGHISVHSAPGKGTSFDIYLPLINKQISINYEESLFESPAMGSETILVVEDEAAVRQLVERILHKYGYKVILAENGQVAIDAFLANRDEISLIFSDLIMPQKSGKELYREVKAVDPDMKFLFTSGYTANMLEKSSDLEGKFEIIRKPVAPLELAKKIREILDSGAA